MRERALYPFARTRRLRTNIIAGKSRNFFIIPSRRNTGGGGCIWKEGDRSEKNCFSPCFTRICCLYICAFRIYFFSNFYFIQSSLWLHPGNTHREITQRSAAFTQDFPLLFFSLFFSRSFHNRYIYSVLFPYINSLYFYLYFTTIHITEWSLFAPLFHPSLYISPFFRFWRATRTIREARDSRHGPLKTCN